VIVVDASAALEVLLRTPRAGAVEARLFAPGERLNAPHLVDLEIAQVLRRHVAADQMTVARADAALDVWRAFPLDRWPHEGLLGRVWALRETLTAYDAAYVALAEALGAPLVTTDGKLARAAGHGARLEMVG
jgi:predicted nucleic acid-binding protein